MCTSSQIQSVAASLEEAASARFATRANRTRSVSGLSLRPARVRRTASSSPRRRHSWSRTCVPPAGREAVTDSSPGSAAARASTGSSSRDRAATRRRTASLSSSSSRPKLYSTLVRDRCVSGSHSLWASCR